MRHCMVSFPECLKFEKKEIPMAGPTGIVYDLTMSNHHCLYDKEPPKTVNTQIIHRCIELNLLERCNRISSRSATKQEIMLLHSEDNYNLLQSTSGVEDNDKTEELNSQVDSVCINPTPFELYLLAVGSTINLVEQIVKGKINNGMALVSLPGHHAMKTKFNNYCLFNSVAIAAKYALEHLNIKRILIIDWDVHHGLGTQRFFYNDPRVVYFCIHRFEYGTFCPNLEESDFNAIGEGDGKGFNFNIPLKKIGMGNGDYLAIFQQVLIPVAIEYQPELVIVSGGSDAALGCTDGEMEITPAFYIHLLNPLLQLANSRVAVVLEGGCCTKFLAESAALTLRALLGGPCPQLIEKLQPPCAEIQEIILNCIFEHRLYWSCLQSAYEVYNLHNSNSQSDLQKEHYNIIDWPWQSDCLSVCPTRGTGPKTDPDVERKLTRLEDIKAEKRLLFPNIRVCYAYDPLMLEHSNTFDQCCPEKPDRLKGIHKELMEYKLLDRMAHTTPRSATIDEICLAHSRDHVNRIRSISDNDNVSDMDSKYDSVYFHSKTFDCASLAAGCVLQVVDMVLSGKARCGVCNVRPPGNHAEVDAPGCFCIFNNVAIAAHYAIKDHHLKRVLIVDWDVHHGNGTQNIFESNPNVLFISVHRFDNGTFFPKSTDGDYTRVGKGDGIGFNINIPWNDKGMGDMEYVMAFQQIIMPIAYEFDPELVLVSAGFDAAIADPFGGCNVTPEAYGLFTQWLSALANGRIILCLEGGFNIDCTSYAMTMCTKTLLGDPIPSISGKSTVSANAHLSCIETIQNCKRVQQLYWRSLVFNKRLPDGSNQNFHSATLKNLDISKHDEQLCKNSMNSATENFSLEPSGSKPKPIVKTLKEFLEENKEALENDEMFAVIPLKTCPHIVQLRPEEAPETINTRAPCNECSSTVENWICLACFKVFCSFYVEQHMSQHNEATKHPLALSFSDLSVWCYPCGAYIDNSRLYKYKNLAHIDKFSAEMTWSYGQDFCLITDEED